MSLPTIGAGTTFSVSPDGTTYTAIGLLTDLKWPKNTVGKVQTEHAGSLVTKVVTALAGGTSSVNIPVKQSIPGWMEPGEHDFKIQYTKEEYTVLQNLKYSRLVYYWKIVFPDGVSTEVFTAWVMDTDGEIPLIENKLVENTVKLQITGLDVFTAG